MIFVVAFGTVDGVTPSMRSDVAYRIWEWKFGPLLIMVGKVARKS